MARVGVVPEEPDAPPAMTARQVADFCRRLYPRWDVSAVAERFARFGLPSDTPFARLSKGQKGEVMLAVALGHTPDLLVLDDRRSVSMSSRAGRSTRSSSASSPTAARPCS